MAASGSAYADVIEIPACAEGSSSSLVRRPRIKKSVPPSKQITLVQLPTVGTEGVAADVNMAPPLKKQKKESGKDIRASSKGVNLEAVEQEALDLATRDPIRLDTQIRSSISQVQEREQLEKEAAATKQVVESEAKKAVDIAVAARNKLIQAFYSWGLNRADVELALAGKYGEIFFPGDDASPVAEQTPAPPVDDNPIKEEVVHLRGKVIEMEKALSRERESINCTQQVYNKLEYERRLHKSNFDKTFKELFELQCRYGKIKIERDEILRKETDRFILLQKSLKDKLFVDESDKLECQRSLLSLTLYFEAEVNSERGLKEAYLELLTERDIVPDPARVKFLVQEARNRHSREAQRCSARAGVSIIWGGGHNGCLEVEKVECARLLQNFEKRVTLLETRLLDTQKCLQVSQSCLKKIITPKRGKRAANRDHERQMADVITFYRSELERVENEFRHYISSCGKDVKVENNKVVNMWFAKRDEGGRALNSKSRAEDSEEEEVEELLSHTRHKTHPQEVVIFDEPLQVDVSGSKVEDKENDNVVAISASNKKLSTKLQQCLLSVKKKTLLNSKRESEMLELQSQLNVVTVELSCMDAEILTANNESEQWKESLKKKKSETMAANQQVLDLL
ncbi:hypothetical protein GIB67_035110, partial [Kingdonia uniflora]